MRLVAECRRANSTIKTNTIMIFLMSNQITLARKRGWALLAFKRFFKLYKVIGIKTKINKHYEFGVNNV